MPIKIYDNSNIKDLNWHQIHQGEKIAPFLETMLAKKSNFFVENTHQEVQLLQIDAHVLPLVIAEKYQAQTTYLSSTLSQYFDLAKEEILMELKGRRSLRAVIAPLVLNVMKNIFKGMGFEKVVFVNNFLLSTNLYPALSETHIKESLHLLKKTFPKHAIVFRSVNETTDATLLQTLCSQGAKPIISRPILMLDPKEQTFQKKRMFKMDEKLWKKNKTYYWTSEHDLSSEEVARVRKLYEALYREKYSIYNPAYKESLIKVWLASDFMEFKFLRDKDAQIVGVTAFLKQNGILTTPFIGYDQNIPLEEGLYRFLNLKLMEESIQQGLILNMSSGAAHFKRLRGGTTFLEYNVAFFQHLPWYRQLPWKIYHQLSERFAIPTIKKYGL